MDTYTNNFNGCETIPIKVNRVFDSCSDKDCITNIPVVLSAGSELPAAATIIKTRCINVSDACINVEPIPFNKGFYSVDISFNFDIQMMAYEAACSTPTSISGTASVSKNCILFGSETNTKTFSSDGSVIGSTDQCCNTVNPPTAIVQTVSPLVLESKISNVCTGCECGSSDACTSVRTILLTIGLFYVVELVRPVTIMVPAYNYTIPQKECCSNNDTPCEVFDKIKFPVEEFSPVKLENSLYGCGCAAPYTANEQNLISEDCGCQNE